MGNYNYQIIGWPAQPRSKKRREMNVASGSVAAYGGGGGSDVDLSGYIRIEDLLKTTTDPSVLEIKDTNVFSALLVKTYLDNKANSTHDHRSQLIRPAVFVVPQQSPSDAGFSLEEGEAAFYIDPNGNYAAETPPGGVSNVFNLTLKSGETVLGLFRPGVEDKTIDIAQAFNGYALQSWVSQNFNNYVLPKATASVLGGVKIGSGLYVDTDGVVSVAGDFSDYATTVYVETLQEVLASGIASNSSRITSLEDRLREWDIDDYIAPWAQALVKPSYALSELSEDSTHRLVTDTLKSNWNTAYNKSHEHSNKSVLDGITAALINTWNGKYAKPSAGIPASDLASAVQTSLAKADSALQEHQSLLSLEDGVASNSARLLSLEDRLREWDIDDYIAPWAQALVKPSYTLDEIPDGTLRKMANYLPLAGGTLTGTLNARSVLPTANNSYNLGSSSARWAGIYGQTVNAAAIEATAEMIIPQGPPSNPVAGKSYFYINPNGNYGIQPS